MTPVLAVFLATGLPLERHFLPNFEECCVREKVAEAFVKNTANWLETTTNEYNAIQTHRTRENYMAAKLWHDWAIKQHKAWTAATWVTWPTAQPYQRWQWAEQSRPAIWIKLP